MQKHTPYHLLHKKLTGEINSAESSLLDRLIEVDVDAEYASLETELGEIWNQAEGYNPSVVFNADAAFAKFQDRIKSEQGEQSQEQSQEEQIQQEQPQNDLPEVKEDIKIENEGQPAKVMRMKPLGRLLPLAASFLLLMLVFFAIKNFLGEAMTTQTTPGMHMMADGSQIWLNENSDITYPEAFNDNREIKLSGEAYFKVSNAAKPFNVITDAGSVSVIGTEFTVDADSKNIEVAVIEGSVELSHNGDTKTIKEKQKAFNQDGVIEVETLATRNIANWRAAGLSFKSDNLSTVVNDLEIYFGVDIKIAESGVDTMCENITSPNVPHDSSVEAFFDNTLNTIHKIDYTKNADGSFTISKFVCTK